MSEPYMWVYDSPGYFDPRDGGHPPEFDMSPVQKPGYFPLYRDDLRAELVTALACCLGHMTGNMDGDWDISADPLALARAALAKAQQP